MAVEKSYTFDGPNGPETLAQLFDGRSQLVVYLHVRSEVGSRLSPLLVLGGQTSIA